MMKKVNSAAAASPQEWATTKMNYETIQYEVADNIPTITLNRPGKLNALTGTIMLELIDAFDRVDADDEMRAFIVTGAGRAYCAGAYISSGVSRRQHT